MNNKRIPLLLLPLVAVFVNSYANLHQIDVIEYKGKKASAEKFFWHDKEFRENVQVYAPTIADASRVFVYKSIGSVKYLDFVQEEEMEDLMEEMGIDNLAEGITYCPGNDVNEPAIYLTKKGTNCGCDEFYRLIQHHNKQ